MLNIRIATIDDSTAICSLNRDALGYDYTLEQTKKRLENVLKFHDHRIWVAEFDGVVVGYVHGCAYECVYTDSLKDIMAIAVDEAYRGMGIGRALLDTLERWAKDTGSAGVRLVSGVDREKAHHFYWSCGYVVRKEHKNFIKIF